VVEARFFLKKIKNLFFNLIKKIVILKIWLILPKWKKKIVGFLTRKTKISKNFPIFLVKKYWFEAFNLLREKQSTRGHLHFYKT